jgi:hypothetical protein
MSGHRLAANGAAVGALGPLTAPATGWPKAVAYGRGVRRMVLPPGGRAGQVALAMGARIWQHGGGRKVVHRRLPSSRCWRRPAAKPDRLHRGVC